MGLSSHMIIDMIIKAYKLHGFSWHSLTTNPYCSQLLASLQDSIQSSQRADESKILLISQY